MKGKGRRGRVAEGNWQAHGANEVFHLRVVLFGGSLLRLTQTCIEPKALDCHPAHGLQFHCEPAPHYATEAGELAFRFIVCEENRKHICGVCEISRCFLSGITIYLCIYMFTCRWCCLL